MDAEQRDVTALPLPASRYAHPGTGAGPDPNHWLYRAGYEAAMAEVADHIAILEARDRDATFFYDYLKHIENALDNMGVAPMEQFMFPARLVHRVTSMGGRL